MSLLTCPRAWHLYRIERLRPQLEFDRSYSDPIILIGDVAKACTRYTASLGVGNWLVKPVKISELSSADDLLLLVQSDDQHSCDMWNRQMARRNFRTVLE